MEKTTEILNRILLNMKYDSRMTLKENNNIILKEQSPKITIDKPEFIGSYEYGTKTELAPDGGKLILPKNAKVVSRFTTIDRPKNVEFYCQKLINSDPDLKNKSLEDCVGLVIEKYRTSVSKNSVSSFEVDGKKYIGCYGLIDKNLKLIQLKNQKFFSEYSTSCNPPGESWVNSNTQDNTNNNQGSKTEGGYEDEYSLSLDLTL